MQPGDHRAFKVRLIRERMFEKETKHFSRRVRPSRIGVGTGKTASGSGVAGTATRCGSRNAIEPLAQIAVEAAFRNLFHSRAM